MSDASAVSVIAWDDVSDFRALLHHAQGTDAEIIYLTPSDVRDASPPKQVEAAAEFADPRVVLVVVGEGPPMLIRKFIHPVGIRNPETPDRHRGRGTGPARLRGAIRLHRALHPITRAGPLSRSGYFFARAIAALPNSITSLTF